jgi:hypothetical protein
MLGVLTVLVEQHYHGARHELPGGNDQNVEQVGVECVMRSSRASENSSTPSSACRNHGLDDIEDVVLEKWRDMPSLTRNARKAINERASERPQ